MNQTFSDILDRCHEVDPCRPLSRSRNPRSTVSGVDA